MLALLFMIAFQNADPLTEPPALKDESACICPALKEKPDVTLSGHVVDARVILSADQRSVEDRMATIFDVKTSDAGLTGRTAVWHDVSDAKCGVTFDYGKNYSVAARRGENGDLETDRCLMAAN
ncbi:MAG: hypothetical protein AAFW68_07065 [Pseudomonadota bacterium]